MARALRGTTTQQPLGPRPAEVTRFTWESMEAASEASEASDSSVRAGTPERPQHAGGKVRLFALGGLGEVGMNCMAIEQRGELMLIDCGVTFDGRGLGVDVVHPDFAALEAYAGRIAGVFLTHGHEDHIGALPYLLRRHDVPIYGPRYALELVRARMAEHEILSYAHLVETAPGDRVDVGSFVVEPIRVTHSIPDATALAIHTDAGIVIHSGDFKIDPDQGDGAVFDAERLSAFGDQGVSLLMSDSTNIDSEGTTGSERGVAEALEGVVRAATGAVVVGLFASNVHRLRMLGAIAKKTRRRIVMFGRSVETHARIARATGHLEWPSDLVFPADRVRELPRESILGVATGTQGESRAALARMAFGEHPSFVASPGDTFVLSSRIIPGNDPEVFAIMSELLRRGAIVKTRMSDRGIHVSGHAHREEQRRMLELVRPRAFMPVHGTLHHLLRHAALAREVGVEHVLAVENGQVVEVSESGIAKAGGVPHGRVHTWAQRAVATDVIRERRALADSGALVISLPLRAGRGVDPSHVHVTALGVVEEAGASTGPLFDKIRNEVAQSVADGLRMGPPHSDVASLAEAARLAARRVVFRALGFKPVTRIHVGGD